MRVSNANRGCSQPLVDLFLSHASAVGALSVVTFSVVAAHAQAFPLRLVPPISLGARHLDIRVGCAGVLCPPVLTSVEMATAIDMFEGKKIRVLLTTTGALPVGRFEHGKA